MLRIFSMTVSGNNDVTILANIGEGHRTLEEAVAAVEARTGLKFRGLRETETNVVGTTATIYAKADKIEIDDKAIDWQLSPGVDCYCGENRVRVSVANGNPRIDKIRSDCSGLVRFKDTTYEDMLMDHLLHYLNQYVHCEKVRDSICFNGNMDFMDMGLRLNRPRKPTGNEVLRISMTHHPIPVVYKHQSIIAIDKKIVSNISSDFSKLELSVCDTVKYRGRLLVNYQCDTAFIVLDDYTPINGYSISTDNPYTAIFIANSLSYDKRLVGDIRRLPTASNSMLHLC